MKLFTFIPLFAVVLIVYNIVIFTKPEWMLEPELFDTSHTLTQAPIPAGETPPLPPPPETETIEATEEIVTEAPVEGDAAAPAPVEETSPPAPPVPEAPEELVAEVVDISARPIAKIALPSGVNWKPIASDILLLFAVFVLYLELYKTTRTGGASAMAEHFLSFLVFLIFLAEFLMIRQCATSAFFIVMMLSLVDVIGGLAISRVMVKKKKAG